jgi:hypothetical protein
MHLVLVQKGMPSAAIAVLQGLGVVRFEVGPDPVVDGLPSHAEHAGEVGGGASVIEFQHGEGTPLEADVVRPGELTPETFPLPRGQVEPAHRLLLNHRRS